MRILVTRPEPDNARTAQALVACGHEPLLDPMLVVTPVIDARPTGTRYSAVVMTSANAARAWSANPHHANLHTGTCFAVGRRTAEAAWAIGFSPVISTSGDQKHLVERIRNELDPGSGPLLYLAGRERAGDLGGDLARQGFEVETLEVYQAGPAQVLSEATRIALASRAVLGVLHYSRRTAETFLDLVATAGLTAAVRRAEHYCLSAQVAAPLFTAGVIEVQVAEIPDESHLLALIPSPYRSEIAQGSARS